MQNPFESLEIRLTRIEALLTELNRPALPADETQYGTFDWYVAQTGEAHSTARQRIARGEVPGITKLGKRLIFDKSTIRSWIQENQRTTNTQQLQSADESFSRRHSRRKKSMDRV